MFQKSKWKNITNQRQYPNKCNTILSTAQSLLRLPVLACQSVTDAAAQRLLALDHLPDEVQGVPK